MDNTFYNYTNSTSRGSLTHSHSSSPSFEYTRDYRDPSYSSFDHGNRGSTQSHLSEGVTGYERTRDRRNGDSLGYSEQNHSFSSSGRRHHPYRKGDREERTPFGQCSKQFHKQVHEPSQNVVVHGIDYDMNESALFFVLREAQANIASVRIGRDSTGASKGFAFVSFSTTEDAQYWIEKQRGLLKLDDRLLRVEYMKNASWYCPKCGFENWKREELGCFKCSKETRHARNQFNDGTSDIGQSPTYLVLIRGLNLTTSEDNLFKTLQKSSNVISHIRMVKNKANHASLGFAFVQFPDVESASDFVVNSYSSPISIDGQYISVTYSHPNSFVVLHGDPQWRTSEYFDAEGRYIEIAYWDERAFAKEYPQNPPIDPELIKASQGLDSNKEKHNSLKTDVDQTVNSLDDTKVAPETEQIKEDDSSKVQDDIKDKKKKPVTVKGKASIQIQKWNSRQEELAADEDKPNETVDLSDEALEKKISTIEEINETFSDKNIMACLLCERQFKSLEDLGKHQAKSNLHKEIQANMEEFRQKKILELRETLMQAQEQDIAYRNRALEMKKLNAQKGQKVSFQMKKKVANPFTPTVTMNTPIGEDNIGNKLLKKMGWKTGEGLGANKDGITAPIEPERYVLGSGLGSSSLQGRR